MVFEGTVRPNLIVFSAPLLNNNLRFGHGSEDFTDEQLIPEFAVERFYIPILPETTRLNKQSLHFTLADLTPLLGSLWRGNTAPWGCTHPDT